MSDVCKLKVGNLLFELDASDERTLFEKIAHVQEVFGNNVCGKCGNTDTKLRVRTVEDDKYYEGICPQCFARFSFGCHKKGNTLFPKRKNDKGEYLPDNGWVKWNPETKKEE